VGTKVLKKLFIGLLIMISCIGLTMNANALSERGEKLLKIKHVVKVFEFEYKNFIIWLDADLDGDCDSAILYLYIGKDGNGVDLYQMLPGSCDLADKTELRILNEQQQKKEKLKI